MTRQKHLLSKLAEECNEVAQRALKAQQFGIKEIQAKGPSKSKDPDAFLNNAERLQKEYADLVAIYEMLQAEGMVAFPTRKQIMEKKFKVERYLTYAKKIRQLTGK